MTEILEDSIFVGVFLIVIVITMHPVSESVSFKCGWMLVVIPMTSLLFAFGVMIVSAIVAIVKACKNRKKKKKLTPQNLAFRTDLSPSNTLPEIPVIDYDSKPHSSSSTRNILETAMYRVNGEIYLMIREPSRVNPPRGRHRE